MKKKIPYFRPVKYKVGDKPTQKKEIVKRLPSRGDNHYFLVKCLDCNKLDAMHQEAIAKKLGCRHCYRLLSGLQDITKRRSRT